MAPLLVGIRLESPLICCFSCGYVAQLVSQSTSAYALVGFPVKNWVIYNMASWSIVTVCTGMSSLSVPDVKDRMLTRDDLSRGKVVRRTTHRFESSSVTSSPPSSLHSSSSSRCGGLDEYNPTNDRPSGLPRRFRESLVCPDSPHTLTLMSDSGLLMAFGIGEATTRTSSSIQPYQGIFVFLGCVSLAFVPLIWFMMPNSPDYRKGHQARRRPTHRD